MRYGAKIVFVSLGRLRVCLKLHDWGSIPGRGVLLRADSRQASSLTVYCEGKAVGVERSVVAVRQTSSG